MWQSRLSTPLVKKIAGLLVCRKINLWHSAYFVSNCISDLRSNPGWLGPGLLRIKKVYNKSENRNTYFRHYQKSVFCPNTPNFVNGPFVALVEPVHFAPWDRLFDFSFPRYGCFRKKKKRLTRQKVFPHPTVWAPSLTALWIKAKQSIN